MLLREELLSLEFIVNFVYSKEFIILFLIKRILWSLNLGVGNLQSKESKIKFIILTKCKFILTKNKINKIQINQETS